MYESSKHNYSVYTIIPVIDVHFFETGSDKAADPDTINLIKTTTS